MKIAISPQLRVVLLVGVLAVLALLVGTFALGRAKQATSEPAPLPVKKPVAHAKPATVPATAHTRPVATRAFGGGKLAPAKAAPAKAKVVKAAPARAKAVKATPAKAAAKAPARVAPAHVRPAVAAPKFGGGKLAPVKAAPVRPSPLVKQALAAGLPPVVAKAFAEHRVVVVELYASESRLDQLALREASAGAGKAGAGFVRIDVSGRTEKALRALTGALDVELSAPAALVLTAPAQMYVQLDGFADDETVAQAAVNAGQ